MTSFDPQLERPVAFYATHCRHSRTTMDWLRVRRLGRALRVGFILVPLVCSPNALFAKPHGEAKGASKSGGHGAKPDKAKGHGAKGGHDAKGAKPDKGGGHGAKPAKAEGHGAGGAKPKGHGSDDAKGGGHGGGDAKEAQEVNLTHFDLGDFRIKELRPTHNATSAVRIAVQLKLPEGATEKMVENLEHMRFRLRDQVVTAVRLSSSSDLAEPNLVRLQRLILRRINRVLTNLRIEAIYITDFASAEL